ncbi:DUF4239 domain-containing protein [Streptomyces sp. T-3]|nr:DUF4239 domain-containing protein [Streptomyces sp. T-3]
MEVLRPVRGLRRQGLIPLACAAVALTAALVVLDRMRLLPLWAKGLLTVAVAVVLAVLTLGLTLWVLPAERRDGENNPVVVSTLSAVIAVYALVLGFVIAGVWRTYTEVEAGVSREANAVADLEHMSRAFSVPVQRQVQGACRTYLRLVVDEEWHLMKVQRSSERADAILTELWITYTEMKAEERGPTYDQSLTRLNELSDTRRLRLLASHEGVPGLLWVLLYGGPLVALAVAGFFRVSNVFLQRLLLAMVAGAVAFTLFLIDSLERPFDQQITIEPGPFAYVLEHMRQLER